jgi:hypothetical protein
MGCLVVLMDTAHLHGVLCVRGAFALAGSASTFASHIRGSCGWVGWGAVLHAFMALIRSPH